MVLGRLVVWIHKGSPENDCRDCYLREIRDLRAPNHRAPNHQLIWWSFETRLIFRCVWHFPESLFQEVHFQVVNFMVVFFCMRENPSFVTWCFHVLNSWRWIKDKQVVYLVNFCNLVSVVVQLPWGNNQDGYPCKASWLTSWCRIYLPSNSVEHIVFWCFFLLSGGNFHTKSLAFFFWWKYLFVFFGLNLVLFSPNLLIFSHEIELLTFPATMQETESLKTTGGPACRTFKLTFN